MRPEPFAENQSALEMTDEHGDGRTLHQAIHSMWSALAKRYREIQDLRAELAQSPQGKLEASVDQGKDAQLARLARLTDSLTPDERELVRWAHTELKQLRAREALLKAQLAEYVREVRDLHDLDRGDDYSIPPEYAENERLRAEVERLCVELRRREDRLRDASIEAERLHRAIDQREADLEALAQKGQVEWRLLEEHERLQPGDELRCSREPGYTEWEALSSTREAVAFGLTVGVARDRLGCSGCEYRRRVALGGQPQASPESADLKPLTARDVYRLALEEAQKDTVKDALKDNSADVLDGRLPQQPEPERIRAAVNRLWGVVRWPHQSGYASVLTDDLRDLFGTIDGGLRALEVYWGPDGAAPPAWLLEEQARSSHEAAKRNAERIVELERSTVQRTEPESATWPQRYAALKLWAQRRLQDFTSDPDDNSTDEDVAAELVEKISYAARLTAEEMAQMRQRANETVDEIFGMPSTRNDEASLEAMQHSLESNLSLPIRGGAEALTRAREALDRTSNEPRPAVAKACVVCGEDADYYSERCAEHDGRNAANRMGSKGKEGGGK